MTEIMRGKYIYGTVKVGERGQIVIPLEARKHFEINSGDLLLVVGDKNFGGLGVVKASAMKDFALKIFEAIEGKNDNSEGEKA
jgi:AbrB family looped-hinge helix DNA binding protein